MPDLSHVMPNPVIVPILWGHDYVVNQSTTKHIKQMISALATGPNVSGLAQADASVRAFDAFNSGSLFTLGSDGNLWVDWSPFGNVPPARELCGSSVRAFLGLDNSQIVWRPTSGLGLYCMQTPAAPGQSWSNLKLIAPDVMGFQPVTPDAGYYLTTDGSLNLVDGITSGSFSRIPIDQPVMEFAATEPTHVLVLKTDASLRLEKKVGVNPITRVLIDDTVA